MYSNAPSGALYLGATVVYPNSPPPAGGYPGAVLVAGSGANDRWEDHRVSQFGVNTLPYALPYNNSFCYLANLSIKPFHDIATYLADHAGLAVLAVDQRSCVKINSPWCQVPLCVKPGQANCLNASMIAFDDFITDAVNSVSALRQWGANPSRITVIGHSMGCTVAPLAANASNAEKVVLLMGSATTIGTTLMRQLSQNLVYNTAIVNSSICNLSDPAQLQLYNEVYNNVQSQAATLPQAGAVIKQLEEGMNVGPYTPITIPGLGGGAYIYWRQWMNLTTSESVEWALSNFLTTFNSKGDRALLAINSWTDFNVSPFEFLPLKVIIDKFSNANMHIIPYLTHFMNDAQFRIAHVNHEVLQTLKTFLE